MIRSLLFASCLFLGFATQAQTLSNGTGGGNWSDPGTWIGGIVPDFNSGVITIQAGDQVNVDTNLTIDQTTVQVGATLVVDPIATLSINNGTGTDFTMSGTLIVEGQLVLLPVATHTGMLASNTTFVAGAIYRHRFTTTQGVIPLATWDIDSEVVIEGYTGAITGTVAGNWNQAFGDFTWNCPAQTGVVNLAGFLTSVNNFTVLSTGTNILRLSVGQDPTIDIAHDLFINGTSRVDFSTTGTATIVNVGGDFSFNSTSSATRLNTTGSCTLNIAGDLTVNGVGGIINLSGGAGGIGTINLSGNFDLQAGTITETSSGSGVINFVGDDVTHVFTNTGTIANTISYNIPVSGTVIVTGESIIQGGTGSSLTVDGTLVVQSENATGAIITGTATGVGNVRVTTRTFNPGAVLRYAGNGPQFIGNGHPAVAGLITIIDNTSGVSLNTSSSVVTIGGDLTLENGDLTVELDNFVVDGTISLVGGDINFITTTSTRTLTSNGIIDFSGGNISVTSGTANATLIVNGDITGDGGIEFTGTNCNLTIGGSGDFSSDFPLTAITSVENMIVTRAGGSVVFPQELTITNLLTVNDGAVIMNAPLNASNDITMNGGSLVMNATLVVNDDLNMAAGSTLFFEGQTVELRSQYNNALSGGLLSSDAASTLNVLNTGVLGTIEFDPAGNTLGTFFIDRSTGGTLVTLNSVLTIETAFTLQNGDFLNTSGLAFVNGAILTRNNLGAFSAGSVAPVGGPYDLVYIGGGMTTGVESSGNLANLTSNASGTIALGGNVAVVSDITVNSGIVSSGANLVSTENLNIISTFLAPTAGGSLTLTGNIVNNGTFNRSDGTVIFDGNSSILGTNNPAFNNITINGILTPPTTLNIHGAFTNNGTFNNTGAGTVAFLGTAAVPQVVSGATVTDFFNIDVSNTSAVPDVTIESNQNLHGVLTLGTTAIVDADGSADASIFTLISTSDDPTQDAAIATLPGTASVQGNVRVQRYMSIEGANSGRIYRYISSPVQNAHVAQIQSFLPVTGSFTGTSTCTGCGSNQSMFLYNENVITDINSSGANDTEDGYLDFPDAANTEILTPGRGYTLFIRSNVPPISTAGSALWSVRAPINSGTINFNSFVSFTSSGNVANDGWNLVGNPYPSTIDWDAATGWTRTNVTNAIYMRDNGQVSPVYATYVGGVGTNGGSRFIPIGQAFFIKSNGGAINFQANENVKVAGTQGTFFRESSVSDLIRVTLKKDQQMDEAVVRFSALASNGYDENLDAVKLPNAIFNLSSISGTSKYAINSIPHGSCNSTIQLNISNAAPGNYELMFTDLQSFSSMPQVSLVDSFTGLSTQISNETVYSFSVTSDPTSSGNRFSLLIDQPQINLSVQAEFLQNLCKETPFTINLPGAEPGVSYYASINGLMVSDKVLGAGGEVILNVLSEKLTVGENSISIFAQRSECTALPLENTVKVTVEGLYNIQSVTDGASCQAGQVSLKATGAPSNGFYRWYDSDTSAEPVAETSEAAFITPILDKSRSYFVAAVNSLGCEGDRVEVQAVIENFENIEITEFSYGLLTSNYAHGNKWFYNNELIQGASGQTISVTQSGLYRVEVEIGSCKTVDEFEFIITAVETKQFESLLYPNPVLDKLFVKVAGLDVRSIEIVSNTGSPVGLIEVSENADEVEVEFTDKPTGLYLIKLRSTRNTISTFKIIKQ